MMPAMIDRLLPADVELWDGVAGSFAYCRSIRKCASAARAREACPQRDPPGFMRYHGSMVLDPAIGILVVACVALLFASAGAHKLRDIRRFDEIFAAYQMVPAAWGRMISRLVPILEIAVAVGLAVNVFRPYAAGFGILMLAGYAAAIAVNLRRGRRDLDCGCGGPGDRRPISAWMIGRNAVVALAAAAAVFATWSARPLRATDGMTIAFGLLTVALVYLCIDQLFGNAQRARRQWSSR